MRTASLHDPAGDARAVLDEVDLASAVRQLLRVLRRDFLEPLRTLQPLPEGCFDRLTLAGDDYRLATEDAEPGGMSAWAK